MKRITVIIEDRKGNVLKTVEADSEQAADAVINRVKAADPNALITRTEQEVN